MSDGRALDLSTARRIAEQLRETLAPACERIEIAGSVRREKPEVHDLEIVAIPRIYQRPAAGPPQIGLFGDFDAPRTEPVNAIWEAIEALGMEVAMPLSMRGNGIFGDLGLPAVDINWQRKRTGGEKRSRMFKLWLPSAGVKVDLFMPLPEAWAGIFTIRTGSAEFSEALVTRWKLQFGGSMRDGVLYCPDGRAVETPEEADFFRAIRVRRLVPPLRMGAASVIPY